jgi:phosphatidylserine/phosphatidylglycerophosphate/cardiolipin synthase-like enzyme
VTTKRVIIAVVSMAAVLAGLGAATTASAEPASERVSSVARVAPDNDRAGERETNARPFRMKPGVSFNVPRSQAINSKVLRAIRHTNKHGKIRVMTWNYNSWVFVRALRAAHNRGASVRIIMARTLANQQGPNGPFAVTRRALAKGNAGRRPEYRSWFRTCSHSCRGKGGAMHSKIYLFSKAGASRQIVMSSSANMTGSAAANQYNDMYTIVGRKKPYKVSIKMFNEASKDRPAPFRSYKDGAIMGWFAPFNGHPDIPMQMLNRVRCHGAKGAGINGRTSIRIAQDVFNGRRGERIARRIKELHRSGCNIRLVYSQLVGASRGILAGVPKNHLVADRDGDGAYDIYLHMKAMSISGNYHGDRGARIVFNGSANWSGIALIADENGLVIRRDGVERKYGRQINKLFGIHLKSVPLDPETQEDVERGLVIDPYRNMEQ